MKTNWNVNMLRRLILVLAVAAIGMRCVMYATAVDVKGLLVAWNLPGILIVVITAATIALVVMGCWGLAEDENPADLMPGWIWSCALALGIVTMLMTETARVDTLAKIRYWLGWASVPCLLVADIGLHMKKRPFFLFHAIVCLFFGLQLVDYYRLWSGLPQLADYVFQLFCCVGLLLTAYQRTAFDVEMGSIRALRIAELLTAFVCLVGAAGSGQSFFYLAGGMWCLTGLHAPALPEVAEDEYA